MNKAQKNTSKAIALFLSMGLISSLGSCEIGNTDEGGEGGEGGENVTTTEQPATEQDEGSEGGEGS